MPKRDRVIRSFIPLNPPSKIKWFVTLLQAHEAFAVEGEIDSLVLDSISMLVVEGLCDLALHRSEWQFLDTAAQFSRRSCPKRAALGSAHWDGSAVIMLAGLLQEI
jgi:hypothetical protein